VTEETEVNKVSTREVENRTSLERGMFTAVKVQTDFWGLSYEIFESRPRRRWDSLLARQIQVHSAGRVPHHKVLLGRVKRST
jgi:hypothetical protein